MKTSTIIAAFASLTAALPTLDTRQTTYQSDINYFYLQSEVYGDNIDAGTNKSGQYVFSYHTGAGLGMAAEDSNQPGMVAYLNNTDLLFTYNGSIGPWPFAIEYGPYQGMWFFPSREVDANLFTKLSVPFPSRLQVLQERAASSSTKPVYRAMFRKEAGWLVTGGIQPRRCLRTTVTAMDLYQHLVLEFDYFRCQHNFRNELKGFNSISIARARK